MKHSEFFKSLKECVFSPVYLFTGEESYVLKSALSQFINTVVGTDLKEVNLTVLPESADGETIVSACEAIPFMAEKRMVIVQDSGFIGKSAVPSGEEILSAYLEKPADDSILVFVSSTPDKRKKMYKALSKHTVVEFNPLSDAELQGWVHKEIKSKGLEIDGNTISFLCEYADPRPEMLINEILKLTAYKLHGSITKDDVIAVVTPCTDYNMFKMTDAVIDKNKTLALKLLSGLLSQKEDVYYILGAISKQYRQLLRCKVMLAEKASKQEVVSALGIRDFVFNRISAVCKKLTEEQLRKAVHLCALTDEELKTTAKSPETAIYELTVKLAEV